MTGHGIVIRIVDFRLRRGIVAEPRVIAAVQADISNGPPDLAALALQVDRKCVEGAGLLRPRPLGMSGIGPGRRIEIKAGRGRLHCGRIWGLEGGRFRVRFHGEVGALGLGQPRFVIWQRGGGNRRWQGRRGDVVRSDGATYLKQHTRHDTLELVGFLIKIS